MAVIQKIRNRYGKIAGAVIAVALVSFIVSDARNGSFGGIFGGHDTHVMTIDGTKVESKEYEQRVKEYETLTEIYGNRQLDDAARAQIREQVMQSMAYETVVGKMCEKLGIETTEQEKKEMIYGQNAHQLVKQFTYMGQQPFNNENKQFDPARVKGIEDQIAKDPQKTDPYGKFMENWTAVKNYVLRMSNIDKFNTLMAASVYAPGYDAKREAAANGSMASIRYVKVPFTSVADNDVKVTDDDLKAYMAKHKAMFETEQASRAMDYVSFEIIPASADSGKSIQALEEIKDEFSKAKDNKLYVGNKSDDINAFSEAYMNKKNFTSRLADTIMNQPIGSIFGPYLENGSYRITKMVDKKVLPDSVKCRQILVVVNSGKEVVMSDTAAKAKIDSIVAQLNKGVPFDSLVKLSADYNPANAKGETPIVLAQRPTLFKEFGDFVFEGKTGEKKTLKVDNTKNNGFIGYYYIEILEQKEIGPTVQVATITKNLLPSDSTVNAIFGRANEFAAKSTNAAEFDANVKKMGVDKRVADNIKENSYNIQGLGGAREIVKWMYAQKVGDVSKDPFRINDQRYVVAKLTAIEEKGQLNITSTMRPQLEQKVKEEKKAESIMAKFKGQALEAIAAGTGQTVAQSDSVVLGAPFIPGVGFEPKVVGYTFSQGLAPNTVSQGIKSMSGVYFITLLGKTTKPTNPMQEQFDVIQQRKNSEGQMRNYLQQMLQQSISKSAKVEYNMKNF